MSERDYYIFLEKRAHRDGKPYECDTVGGYFQCESTSFTQVFRHPENEKGWGWECNGCGKFFRSWENVKWDL